MLVRPSLVLQVKLQPESYSDVVAEEIKRSFIYLAQPLVKQALPEEAAEGNVMRLSIRLIKPYWDIHDPEACELWDSVMPRWLRNVVRNMSVAMHNFNNVNHPEGCGRIYYDWVDFDFGRNVLIRVKTDGENRIVEDMPRMIEQVRYLMNNGAFADKSVSMIRMPSRKSYETQLKAALAAEQERNMQEGESLSGEESQAAEQHLATDKMPQTALASDSEVLIPEYDMSEDDETLTACTSDSEDLVGNASAKNSDGDAIQDEATDAVQQSSRPSFSIDFRMWGVEYADGTVEEFDSLNA